MTRYVLQVVTISPPLAKIKLIDRAQTAVPVVPSWKEPRFQQPDVQLQPFKEYLKFLPARSFSIR